MIFVHVNVFLPYYEKLEATLNTLLIYLYISSFLPLDPHTGTNAVGFPASDSWLLKYFSPGQNFRMDALHLRLGKLVQVLAVNVSLHYLKQCNKVSE